MPSHGADHPSPFRAASSCAAPGKSVTAEPSLTGQNFRKRRGQNFRNPQRGTAMLPLIATIKELCVPVQSQLRGGPVYNLHWRR